VTDPTEGTAVYAALAAAVTDVLESMFFVEAQGETHATPDDPAVAVEIHFEGDPPGRFQMRLAPKTAQAIAADFLGQDSTELVERQCEDVALELANMICGAVLSRLESSAYFRLGSPKIIEAAALSVESVMTTFTLETGNGRLTAAIQMERRTCHAPAQYAF